MSSNLFDDIRKKVKQGENAGGVLWLGTPARTQTGIERERTCEFSEKAWFGREWLEGSRCCKQICFSCDDCLKSIEQPFYKKKAARDEDDF